MSKYTLRIRGRPIEDAERMLEAADAISPSTRKLSFGEDQEPAQVALTVTVDAPSLEQAEAVVQAALPSHGSYSVGRPDPVEDDGED